MAERVTARAFSRLVLFDRRDPRVSLTPKTKL
jgi:hypothetical protein